MLLGSIPPGVVTTQSLRYEPKDEADKKTAKENIPPTQPAVQAKIALFEEKIREQMPPITTKPRKR